MNNRIKDHKKERVWRIENSLKQNICVTGNRRRRGRQPPPHTHTHQPRVRTRQGDPRPASSDLSGCLSIGSLISNPAFNRSGNQHTPRQMSGSCQLFILNSHSSSSESSQRQPARTRPTAIWKHSSLLLFSHF